VSKLNRSAILTLGPFGSWCPCFLLGVSTDIVAVRHSHPKPYPYELKCRSSEAEVLIRSIADSEEVKGGRTGNDVEL
jgi:hypothetical protein